MEVVNELKQKNNPLKFFLINFLDATQKKQKLVHFTFVCWIAEPLNRSEANGDLVMIETLLLFKRILLCYHAS